MFVTAVFYMDHFPGHIDRVPNKLTNREFK